MADVVVFHSALGLRPAITAFADRLRAAGHRVWTPDLYQGRVFDDVDSGAAERDRIGIPMLIGRAMESVASLPEQLVYIGFSMGTGPAQLLAATRVGARGAILVQGVLPPDVLDVEAWPADVRVQLHVSPDDPWHGQTSLDAFLDWVPERLVDRHDHPDTGHLFTDPDLPTNDPDASEGLARVTLTWLATIEGRVVPQAADAGA